VDPFSSGRTPADSAGQWAHTFRVPIALSVVFLLLLVVFGLTGRGPGSTSDASGATSEPQSTAPVQRCAACGVGETCDSESGLCVLSEGTPPPCLEGSTFDDEQGFCIPDETPQPTPPPAATIDPSRFRTPNAPRTPDVVVFPTPEPEETIEPEPEETPDNE
jgi:hypothetical protein